MKITTLPIHTDNTHLDNLSISLTPDAIRQFLAASVAEDSNIVRIGVKGGGCSGYNYNLEFIQEDAIDPEEDLVSKTGQLTFVMDIFSKEYLKGTVLDYLSSLKESGFKFQNPASKTTCGCGSSFSV